MTWSLVLSLLVFGLQGIAASPVLLSRQYWPDPTREPIPSEAKCIEESFSNPRWGIYDPALITVNGSSGGSQGDIRFLTMNAATGLVANCTAKDIELDPKGSDAVDVWHNCSIPDLFFQFSLTTMDLRLKGTWSCGNSKLLFAANGTWEQPLIQGCLDDWNAPRGEEILCIMGNSQVWGSLSSPIKIAPQLPLLPYTPGELPERCVDRSVDPEWTVGNLLYQHHYSQTKKETQKHYHLTFDLTNISNDEKVACNVTVDQLNGVTNKDGSTSWVDCASAHNSGAGNITSTSVLLDTVNGLLGVKQSWNCTDGIEGIESNDFIGTAYLQSKLQCGSPLNLAMYDPEGNVIGATSDYNCTLVPTNFSGYSPEPPKMPHTSYSRSCTIGSVVNTTSVSLREYEIDTLADGTKLGTFSIFNPGPGDTYRLYRILVKDDGAWHDCVAGSSNTTEPFPWQLVKCQYLLDRSKHLVSFQLQWYCDDRDPSHAILFDAIASTNTLPAEKCDTSLASDGARNGQGSSPNTGEGKLCRLPIDITEVTMPVSTVTWTTLSVPMDRGPTLPWI